ncbi:AMP-binding protein [Variovorax sp. J22R133]|uniref:AMP-binding protein n=1 Tax=Variovorax brevis TaxID=3053503 RepID=UPI0025753E33|nr:AMP-binding protein [Variovorax sp. J22R133]MDM0116287.1 AMP-binding protein [Variovorax sp. J22R133]
MLGPDRVGGGSLRLGTKGLGLQRGDCLGVWSPNRFEWLITQFATALIGAILVTLTPHIASCNLDYALSTS